jgi:2-haloacid dehalogenase
VLNANAGISNVIFDLGGVLIDWNPLYLYRQLFPTLDEAQRFLREVCTPEWNAKQDAGRPWPDAIAEATAQHPDCAHLINAYWERWDEMLGGELTGTVAVLKELHTLDLPLFALTNWSSATFSRTVPRFSFFSLFKDIVVSGREGIAKPDPAIYKLALTRFRISADRTLFIDDSRENIDTARQLGLHVVHFQDSGHLRGELVRMGVLHA